jgi:hypothetical protein
MVVGVCTRCVLGDQVRELLEMGASQVDFDRSGGSYVPAPLGPESLIGDSLTGGTLTVVFDIEVVLIVGLIAVERV